MEIFNGFGAAFMDLFDNHTDLAALFSAVIMVSILTVILTYYIGRLRGSQMAADDQKQNINRRVNIRDAAYYEDKLSTRDGKIRKLNELNERYLTFTENLSGVVKQLYSSLNSREIASAVVSLVKDMFNTDTVEMYVFDRQEQILRKESEFVRIPGGKNSYALGEGLIGSAAEDGIIKIRGVTYTETNLKDYGEDEAKFWMVAPIHFKTRLIGAIGIGKVKDPTGNERNLMKTICDIAGVTLANQSYLQEWKHGSIKDSLTGLYNRRYFSHMVMKYLEKSVIQSFPISICLFDIDHFKNYNDTNGHQGGDRLLKELSDLLARLTRKNAVLARYGGEEFIVMLPDISKEDAFIYAERVKEEIIRYPFVHGEKQPLGYVSVSGGVATFPNDAGSLEKVIELADKALYKAKKEGRNRIIKHDRELPQAIAPEVF